MLSEYFGFDESPFGATPDPRWLYRGAAHREALASLKYGLYSNRGFTALIAHPGMGKTTLLNQFLSDIRGSARSIFVFDTQCDSFGLLRYILRDLGIVPANHSDEMHEQLKEVLLNEARAGRRVVIVVDEAQNLSEEALEMLRLLTNFETPRTKLLHIVLSGQPGLSETLTRPSLEQLRQRISTVCTLVPFSMDQTTAYIRHRLEHAGYRGAPLFKKDALKQITEVSHGIPRLINNLCFNALSLCCAMKCKQVDSDMVSEVIADQELNPQTRETFAALKESAAIQVPAQPRPFSTMSGRKSLAFAATVLVVAAGFSLLALPFRGHLGSKMTNHKQSETSKSGPLAIPQAPNARDRKDIVVAAQNQLPASLAGSQPQAPLVATQQLNRRARAGDSAKSGLDNIKTAPTMSQGSSAEIMQSTVPVSEALSRIKSFRITVEPDQTLQDISARYLGSWDLKRLRQIQALNPTLTNLDHIEAGQKMWLPALEAGRVAPITTLQASGRNHHEP